MSARGFTKDIFYRYFKRLGFEVYLTKTSHVHLLKDNPRPTYDFHVRWLSRG